MWQQNPEPTPEPDPVSPADEKLITDPIVEKAVRYSLEADGLLAVTLPVVELTKTDLKKVTGLILINNEITVEGLKEVAKLQKLEYLNLYGSQITRAAVVEFKKSLPNCNIKGP